MSTAIYYEIRLAVSSFVTGIGLMIVYDLLRIFRMICPHNRVFMGLEDLGFGIYCAVITFGLLYEQNDGALRGYAIVGTMAGMILYQYLVSRILLKYLKKGQKYLRIRMKMRQLRKKRVKR